MSWRLRLSVETILRLTPAVLGSTVFSIAGLCAAHACLDDQALLAAREAIGFSLEHRRDKGPVDGTAVHSTPLDPYMPLRALATRGHIDKTPDEALPCYRVGRKNPGAQVGVRRLATQFRARSPGARQGHPRYGPRNIRN